MVAGWAVDPRDEAERRKIIAGSISVSRILFME